MASGELHVGGERVLRVGRIDEDDALVFIGEHPVAGLLGCPGDEPYELAHREVVNADGEVLQAFDFDWTVDQVMSQAGRHDGPGRELTPDDRGCAQECRSLLEHILRAAIDGVIR
ncbi:MULTISPECIES: hypothetical protein [Sorangium]|uniref:hypothetical protein n=1 Tax=Sorangium TaxID=39643 RepID=UPI003D9C6648